MSIKYTPYTQAYNANADASEAVVRKLIDRYERFDTSIISSIFHDKMNMKITDVQRSPEYGSSHVVYFVTEKRAENLFVFRANLGITPPEESMVVEQLITKKLSEAGIASNEILTTDISRKVHSFDYQIQKYIKGANLGSTESISNKKYQQIWKNLGKVTGVIHQIKGTGFGVPHISHDGVSLHGNLESNYQFVNLGLIKELQYLNRKQVIEKSMIARITNYFADNKTMLEERPSRVIHNDLADHNILVDDSNHYLIDWDNCRLADPIIDVVASMTYTQKYKRDESFLEGYKSIIALPTNFEALRKIYQLRTIIWKTVYAIKKDHYNSYRKKRFEKTLEGAWK